MASIAKPRKSNECCRNEDATMDVWRCEERQDKEQLHVHRGNDRGSVKVSQQTKEKRLGWYGHIKRRSEGYVEKKVLEMDIPGKGKRGRPKLRWCEVLDS